MFVSRVLSHLDAWNSLKVIYPLLQSEIVKIVEIVQPEMTELGHEENNFSRKIISPAYIADQFRFQLAQHGWIKRTIKFGELPSSGLSNIYAVKDKLGVEYLFGKYAFVDSHLFVKFPLFIREKIIDIAVLIMPMKSLTNKMSPEVSSFEMIENRLTQITAQLPKYPFVILGVSDEASELEIIEVSTPIEVAMEKPQEHWDVFISHATEDKEEIARPLAKNLTNAGLRVWFDEFTLKVGQSISESINYGLANSAYGIVILSEHYLRKDWTKRELAGLFAKEQNEKLILPIWHKISLEKIRTYSPILADRLATNSSVGLQNLTIALLEVIKPNSSSIADGADSDLVPIEQTPIGLWHGTSGRLRLFERKDKNFRITGDYDWNDYEWAGHILGNISNGILRFYWWWDKSPEKGTGFLAIDPFDHTLRGGWSDTDFGGTLLKNADEPLPISFQEWKFDPLEMFVDIPKWLKQ